jgi:hypothetical protein
MGLSSGWQADSFGGGDKLSAIERRLPCCGREVNAANVALQHFSLRHFINAFWGACCPFRRRNEAGAVIHA